MKIGNHEIGDYSLVELVNGKWVAYAIRHQGVMLAWIVYAIRHQGILLSKAV